jgi:hypothetical protein
MGRPAREKKREWRTLVCNKCEEVFEGYAWLVPIEGSDGTLDWNLDRNAARGNRCTNPSCESRAIRVED